MAALKVHSVYILSTAAKITQQRWPATQVVRTLARTRTGESGQYWPLLLAIGFRSQLFPRPHCLAGRKPGASLSSSGSVWTYPTFNAEGRD